MNYKIRRLLGKNTFWKDYIQKGGMQNPITKIYKIEYDGEIFEIIYNKEDDFKEIYLKGLKNKCFFIIVEKEGFANIEALGSEPECVKNKHNQKISSIMVCLIFKILSMLKVKTIKFQDNAGKGKYDLADYYFLKNGMTWYDSIISKFANKYTFEFEYPITKIKYQKLKESHKILIGDKLKNMSFEEIEKVKDYYLNLLNLKTLTGIYYCVNVEEWKI